MPEYPEISGFIGAIRKYVDSFKHCRSRFQRSRPSNDIDINSVDASESDALSDSSDADSASPFACNAATGYTCNGDTGPACDADTRRDDTCSVDAVDSQALTFDDDDVLLFRLEIHPQVFSLGTAKKAYTSLTVDKSAFNPPPPCVLDCFWDDGSSNYRNIRSQDAPWQYLLGINSNGPLLWARRGKLLILAAGNHAMLIHFGLEAHIVGMSRADYDEIISRDVPGSNSDEAKASLLRSFHMPERFTEPDSSNPDEPRTVNIFAAFVSDFGVLAIIDFSRLVRLHVMSRNTPWTASDFLPSSPCWDALWSYFAGGPDWLIERSSAEQHLDEWRRAVLEHYHAYLKKHAEWSKLFTHNSTYRIDSYYTTSGSSTSSLQLHAPRDENSLPPKPKLRCRSIIKDIGRNSHRAFSGLGRHCSNDLLFSLALHPGTPCHVICSDDALYRILKAGIFDFLSLFDSPSFHKRAAFTPNSLNPFFFNEKSNETYISSYISVFRRVKVNVSKLLYDQYQRLGLLDPNHTIGEPYPETNIRPLDVQFTWVDVYMCSAPLKAYTIILAKPPQGFMFGTMSAVTKDIGKFLYATTIGCAQFREHLLNRPNSHLTDDKLLYSDVGGRRPAERTHKRGRPRVIGLTRLQLSRRRSRTGRQPLKQDMDITTTPEDEDDGSEISCAETDEESDEELEMGASTIMDDNDDTNDTLLEDPQTLKQFVPTILPICLKPCSIKRTPFLNGLSFVEDADKPKPKRTSPAVIVCKGRLKPGSPANIEDTGSLALTAPAVDSTLGSNFKGGSGSCIIDKDIAIASDNGSSVFGAFRSPVTRTKAPGASRPKNPIFYPPVKQYIAPDLPVKAAEIPPRRISRTSGLTHFTRENLGYKRKRNESDVLNGRVRSYVSRVGDSTGKRTG